MSASPSSVALVGLGAIGRKLVELCRRAPGGSPIRVVLVKPAHVASARASLAAEIAVVSDVPALLAHRPQLVVECAGHAAVRSIGPDALRAGCDLLVASVGALADAATEQALREAAAAGGGRIVIPAGAIGGADLIAAARLAGLTRVTYTSRKRPEAWRGTPAEGLVDLAGLRTQTAFFRGSAREAALAYPQNANVAAAVALAGTGFDDTECVLTADPEAPGNEHRIEVEGTFGRAQFVIAGRTLPDNPKTSMLAALSLARAILARSQTLVV